MSLDGCSTLVGRDDAEASAGVPVSEGQTLSSSCNGDLPLALQQTGANGKRERLSFGNCEEEL